MTYHLGTECSQALRQVCQAPVLCPTPPWRTGEWVVLTSPVSLLPEPIDHDQHQRHWEEDQQPREHNGIQILVPEGTGQSGEAVSIQVPP